MKNFNQKFAEHPELSVFKEFFLSHGKSKEIKKKEYLVEQSSVAKYIAYVVEGFFRYTRIDNRGNEHNVGYVFKGEYVGDYASLIKKDITSLVTVQAVTDCKIYYVPLEEVRKFFNTNEDAQIAGRVLAEELFMVAYTRLLDFYCKNTEELYMDLTERCPDFQNYITLKEMASFLQVTPETISHIRNSINKKHIC